MAMTTAVEKILARAQELEQQAAALRLAAQILGGEVRTKKTQAVTQTLAEAVALRAAQRAGTNGHGPHHDEPVQPEQPKKKKRPGHWKAGKAARRKQTGETLAHYNTTTPQPGIGRIGALVNNGYLKRKGDGYVRTAKPFVP